MARSNCSADSSRSIGQAIIIEHWIDHGEAESAAGSGARQRAGVACAPCSEPEIMSHHDVPRANGAYQDLFDECLGGKSGQRLREALDVERTDTGSRELSRFGSQRGQAPRRRIGTEDCGGMGFEREYSAGHVRGRVASLGGNGQQFLVPEVNTVEIAEGDDPALA